jgi:D-amino-acid dehydrogenase
LPSVAPFLMRYFAASSPERARKTFEANIPLFARCLEAHEALMAEAGSQDLVRKTGWIKLFRKQASAEEADAQARELREIGLAATMLDNKALNALEPDIDTAKLAGGLHYGDPWCCSNPGALVKSYAALYEKLGGETVTAEIAGVERRDGRWAVTTNGPDITAEQLVVTLGPWSKRLLDAVGVNLPMGVKRGYHRHYKPQGDAKLNRPVLDGDVGYVMAPMARGVRLTSGAEFARQDAPQRRGSYSAFCPRRARFFRSARASTSGPGSARGRFCQTCCR